MLIFQGDLTIKVNEVDDKPTNLGDVRKDGVILEGEKTGHAHRLEGGTVQELLDGGLFLEIDEMGRIIHEEHDPIELPAGSYVVTRQREYVAGDARKVVD